LVRRDYQLVNLVLPYPSHSMCLSKKDLIHCVSIITRNCPSWDDTIGVSEI
jgi:hypothetical protein